MSQDAREQARLQYENIEKLVRDQDYDAIHDDALSILVRSDWVEPGKPFEAHDYEILLCTGGPAVRIVGYLDENRMPHTAKLEFQDWGIPWTEYYDTAEKVLLSYAHTFYYGEV